MRKISVLLVDDDPELTEMLAQYLNSEGMATTVVHDGESGVREALCGTHDLVVLDIMLPGLSGIEVLHRLRHRSQLPVLLLTARGDDIERIAGLEQGADDYVPKPCTPGELVARIRAILRRTERQGRDSNGEQSLRAGELELWAGTRQARWQGQLLALTGTEFNLLEELVRRQGRLVSRKELSENALGRPLSRYDRSIDVHISSIRQKLGLRPDGSPWITNVRGMGYQLLTE